MVYIEWTVKQIKKSLYGYDTFVTQGMEPAFTVKGPAQRIVTVLTERKPFLCSRTGFELQLAGEGLLQKGLEQVLRF